MQKKQKDFFPSAGAKQRSLACEVTALTITLPESHGMAAVKTASNIATLEATDGGKAITTSAGQNPCPCAFARWQNPCPCAFTGILIRKVNDLPSIISARYTKRILLLQTVKSGWSAL